jgi:hypothetical protein
MRAVAIEWESACFARFVISIDEGADKIAAIGAGTAPRRAVTLTGQVNSRQVHRRRTIATENGVNGIRKRAVMVYEVMNKAGGPENGEQNEMAARSAFRDLALPLCYFIIITVSMAGWLWFLGYLSWDIVSWAALR